MARTIVGVFNEYRFAEQAAHQVKEQGLRTDDISIIAKDNTNENSKPYTFKMEENNNETVMMKNDINDNISDGIITGSIVGGLAGLLIGAGSIFIPGLGIIAAAGPITGLLSGAVTGGIVGGLVDLGIPEKNSKEYEEHIKSGKVIFAMKTDEDKIEKVKSILNTNNALSVSEY